MASGRPIVASDLPAIREVLTDGHNALLVEAGNPHAVTEGVRRLKDDRELGRRLAAQALADVGEYTWARRAERLEALLAELPGVRS
jgi:glycosyltransferase involved in cell wall biosynthesis